MRRIGGSRSGFEPIGEMTFESLGSPLLGVGEQPNKRIAKLELPSARMIELMADPESVEFRVGGLDLVGRDENLTTPINFDFLEQQTTSKTAHVHVDYGNGNSFHRRIATNVRRKNRKSAGASLAESLRDVLGVEFTTTRRKKRGTEEELNSVLTALKEVQDANGRLVRTGRSVTTDESKRAFWVIASQGKAVVNASVDFEDIRVFAGDSIHLMYVTDQDGDGLYAHDEYRYGTYDSQAAAKAAGVADPTDSDGDTLGDKDEARVGWRVQIAGGAKVKPYDRESMVYSDPSREDADFDGLKDAEEKARGTDPNNPDTDGDTYADGDGAGPDWFRSAGKDPDPLDPGITGNKKPSLGTVSHKMEGFKAILTVQVGDVDGNLKSLRVDWGDQKNDLLEKDELGGTHRNVTTQHSYSATGSYKVRLTLVDDFEKQATKDYEITLSTPTGGLLGEWLFQPDGVDEKKILNTARPPVGDAAKVLGQDKGNAAGWSNLDGRSSSTIGGGRNECVGQMPDRNGQANAALAFHRVQGVQMSCSGPDSYGYVQLPARPSYKQQDGSYSHAPRIQLNKDFTIAVWVRPERRTNRGWIIGQVDSNGNKEWFHLMQGPDDEKGRETNRIGFVLPSRRGSPMVVQDDADPPVGRWTLYIVTVSVRSNTATATLYRNGARVTQATKTGDLRQPTPGNSTQHRLFLGCKGDESSYRYEGGIDDVRVYGRLMSPDEINVLYQSTR